MMTVADLYGVVTADYKDINSFVTSTWHEKAKHCESIFCAPSFKRSSGALSASIDISPGIGWPIMAQLRWKTLATYGEFEVAGLNLAALRMVATKSVLFERNHLHRWCTSYPFELPHQKKCYKDMIISSLSSESLKGSFFTNDQKSHQSFPNALDSFASCKEITLCRTQTFHRKSKRRRPWLRLCPGVWGGSLDEATLNNPGQETICTVQVV